MKNITTKTEQTMKHILKGSAGFCAMLTTLFFSCQKEMNTLPSGDTELRSTAFKSNTNKPEGLIFYALADNTLDKYNTSHPETPIASVHISGLQPEEKILDIDFRPKTGQLYALGNSSRVYIINPATGAATFAFSFVSNATGMPVLLDGSSFGFDFNPQVDRLRILSNTGQNLRIVPDNAATGIAGTTFEDGRVNPQPAMLTGAAYTNNFAGTTSTKLYALDAATDQLHEINPPNAGTLSGSMNVNLKMEGDGGFDIAPRNEFVSSDIALALYEVNKKSTLFFINVQTGESKILAYYDKAMMYSALAISPERSW